MLTPLLQFDWPRILFARSAAILLGLAAVLSVGGVIIGQTDFSLDALGPLEYKLLSIAGAASAIGFFALIAGMGYFWIKCDGSSRLGRTVWFVLLLAGIKYGSFVAYYAAVYLPAVIERSRNPYEERFTSERPRIGNGGSWLNRFRFTLAIGWGLLVVAVATYCLLPKGISDFLSPASWAFVVWPVTLVLATAFYAVFSIFWVGIRRPASSSQDSRRPQ
jgi:hypothetical protein